MKIIIVCSQSIVFLSVLFAVFTSATALIAGSGSITVLSGCDDTHYRLNITTVSRPAWRGLQGVTASSTEGSHTWKHTHTHTHTHTQPTQHFFVQTDTTVETNWRICCENVYRWRCRQRSLSHTHTHTHTHFSPQLTPNLAWTHTCPASFHFTDHQNFSALDVQIQISHTWKHPKTTNRWWLNVEFCEKQGGTNKIINKKRKKDRKLCASPSSVGRCYPQK